MNKIKPRNAKAEASLFRYLKGGPGVAGGRLILAECGGHLWWSDSYLMAPVTDDLRHLLSDFNLKAEPMVCIVGRTIVRSGQTVPDFDKLMPGSLKGWKPITPLTVIGQPVYTEDLGRRIELWSTDNTSVTHRFNSACIAQVLAAGGDRLLVDPHARTVPAVRVDGAKPVGLIMPVRSESVLAPWADEAEAA